MKHRRSYFTHSWSFPPLLPFLLLSLRFFHLWLRHQKINPWGIHSDAFEAQQFTDWGVQGSIRQHPAECLCVNTVGENHGKPVVTHTHLLLSLGMWCTVGHMALLSLWVYIHVPCGPAWLPVLSLQPSILRTCPEHSDYLYGEFPQGFKRICKHWQHHLLWRILYQDSYKDHSKIAQSQIAYTVVSVIFLSPSLPPVMSSLMCPSPTSQSTALNFSDQNHEPWRRSWISLGTDPEQAPPAQSCFALSPKTLVGIGYQTSPQRLSPFRGQTAFIQGCTVDLYRDCCPHCKPQYTAGICISSINVYWLVISGDTNENKTQLLHIRKPHSREKRNM